MPNLSLEKSIESAGRNRDRHLVCLAMLAISLALGFKTLAALAAYAFSQPDFVHVLLIPFIALGLILSERKEIFRLFVPFRAPGIFLSAAGAVLFGAAAWKSNSQAVSLDLSAAMLGLVSIWIGIFLVCYGSQAMRSAAFPLLLLILMVPIPDPAVRWIIYRLQAGSTDITYFIFKVLDVPAIREGFVISVPGFKIEVAPECSGIRSSIALLITCLLAAHYYLRTFWRKVVFLLFVLPFSMLKNGIRIATLTLLSLYVDPSFLTGSLHRDGGFVFFLLALSMLGGILLLLQKSEGLKKSGVPLPGAALEPSASQ